MKPPRGPSARTTAIGASSRAPDRPKLRTPKAMPPPSTDGAAARAARDQARARPFRGSAPTLNLAGSWQDLVTGITLDPGTPAFNRPCTLRFNLSHRAVAIQVAGKQVLVSLSGSASVTASLSLYIPEPPP